MSVTLVGFTLTNNPAPLSGLTAIATLPVGVADGDILLMVLASTDGVHPPAAVLSGWTQIINATVGVSDTEFPHEYVWWKVAASEPATYTVTYTIKAGGIALKMYAFRGATSPIAIYGKTDVITGATLTAPSITTTVDATLVLANFPFYGLATAVTTPPAGYTDVTGAQPSSTFFNTYFAYTKVFATAGATGTATLVLNNSSTYGAAMLIAIPPTGDVPPPPDVDVVMINFGPVDQVTDSVFMTTDAVESTDCYLGGFRYRNLDMAMRVVIGGTPLSYNVGLGFDTNGALCVTTSGGAADANYNGLSTISKRLKVSYLLSSVVHIHGWPVASDGSVVAIDGSPHPPTIDTRITSTSDTRTTSGGDTRITA